MKNVHLISTALLACIFIAPATAPAQPHAYGDSIEAQLTIQQPLYKYQRIPVTFSAANRGSRPFLLISGKDDGYMKVETADGMVYTTNTSKCTPGPGVIRPGDSFTNTFYITTVGEKRYARGRAPLGMIYQPGQYTASMEVRYTFGDTGATYAKQVTAAFTVNDVSAYEETLAQEFIQQMDSLLIEHLDRRACCDRFDNIIIPFLERNRGSQLHNTFLIAAATRANTTCSRLSAPLLKMYLMEYIDTPFAWDCAYALKSYGLKDGFYGDLRSRYPNHEIVEYLGRVR